MKGLPFSLSTGALTIVLFVGLSTTQSISQTFQRTYGTSLDNSFTKAIGDGGQYFVLGQDQPSGGSLPHATVTRLDANGNHQWTLTLDIPSVWNDAIRTPSGDLFLVGSTLPGDASSKSLMGLVTPTSGGTFTWLRSYDVTGRESLTKVIRNPSPQNPLFPYYAVGAQFDPNGGPIWDDIILINLDEAGTFNWKKRFPSPEDDEFARDLEVMANGDLIIAGNKGSQGVLFRMDNAGNLISGATPDGLSFSYADIASISGGGFYSVGGTFPAFTAYLTKYDNDLIALWDVTLSDLTSVRQVWEASGGGIYITGTGVFNGISRGVILYLLEIGNVPVLQWMKYLDNGETSYALGLTTFLPPNQMAFADGRIPVSGGFGQQCAFISISDLQLNTCMTTEDAVDVQVVSLFYSGPFLELIEFFDFPTGTDIFSSGLMWQQADVCDNDPCQADFIITQIGDCGHYQVNNTSTGAQPLTYSWCNGSVSQDLDVFLPCGPQTFCLTITDASGCTSSYQETITVTDNTPPVALCVPSFGVTLDTNCTFLVTPALIDGGSFDNCQLVSLSVSPAILNGCGVFPITLTATDWCGNTSTCTTFIQTIESTPPTINCPSNLTITAPTLAPCSVMVNNIQPSNVTVVCGPANVSYSITGTTFASGLNDASGTVFNQGVSTVTYTVFDGCENMSTCSFTVTVLCEGPSGELNMSCGMAVVTCFPGFNQPSYPTSQINNVAPVIGLKDIRNTSAATLGYNWNVQMQAFAQGNAQNIGQVFGLAIDTLGRIYTSSSTIYGSVTNLGPFGFQWGIGGPGGIYRFTYNTGTLQWDMDVFASLPNTGSGLGNITYDRKHDQFFVTNHADGLIYRIQNSPTNIQGTVDPIKYDYQGTTHFAGNPGYVALGERLWGIGYNEADDRVYFAAWNEDNQRYSSSIANEIYSIGLSGTGSFLTNADQRKEITTLDYPNAFYPSASNPVSDIEFSDDGNMVVAEKVMFEDWGDVSFFLPGMLAHKARIYQYTGSSLNWNGSLIHIGNAEQTAPGSHNNSAGGVDYGYQDIDAFGVLSGCDSLIWGTGDALMYNNNNQYTGNADRVYGIAGMPSGGNSNTAWSPTWVESGSLYVDLDGSLANEEKTELGDVDIYNCVCPPVPGYPCDSLMVMYDAVSSPNDSLCCYSIDFKNLEGNITQICANVNTPDWIFNTGSLLLAGSYTWNLTSPNQLCIGHPGGIPLGQLNDVLTFCLAETTPNAAPVQQIIFSWYAAGAAVCKDTIYTECNPPAHQDTCLVISNLEAECLDNNDLEYCVTFTVSNPNPTDAYALVLGSLPPGFAYGDCGCGGSPYGNGEYQFSGFPLIQANSTQSFCVKIYATSPILSPTEICFKATLEFGEDCCSSTKDWCVELEPCCDPCESTFVQVHELDSCCYALDFHYDCDFAYYTHIDIDILTPGVSFGWHANDPNWSVCTTPTLDHVCIQPLLGNVPPGIINNLFSFCLTDINMPSEIPQQVQITYWTTGSNGLDSIACDTILDFNCDLQADTCVFIANEEIRCIADSMKYAITVTVQNLSVPNFTAYNLGIIGPGITPNPIPLVPPLPNDGSTRTVTFCYTPNPWPDADGQLLLVYRLKSITGDTCCNGNQSFVDTLMLPTCVDSCVCGTFSDMAIRFERGPGIPLMCGAAPVVLSCPPAGYTYTISGKFQCMGSGCPDEAPFDAQLEMPDGQIISLGSQFASPYFGIPVSNLDLQQVGVYTVTLTGHCGAETCTCLIKFIMDPPCTDVCPCTIADIQAFSNAVDQGFAQVLSTKSCKACFTPIALSDCETVEWYLTNTNGSPIGTSTGNNSFCYSFPGSGTYTVIMVATRKKADGTNCETFTKSQTVTITCLIWAECSDSVFDNPSFGEGAVEGDLDAGGRSSGWKKMKPAQPKTEADKRMGSFDGWAIDLSGNLESSGILTRIEPVCIQKDSGLITVRIAVNDSGVQVAAKKAPDRPCDRLEMRLFRGDNFDLDIATCNEIDCYTLASIPLSDLDTGWHELQIPYDLRNWLALDGCDITDAVLIRPAIYVTNALMDSQGGEDTWSHAQLDNFCFGGVIVAVDDPLPGPDFRIYPNPNDGNFTVELGEIARPGLSLQVIGLTGELLLTTKAIAGAVIQNIDADQLSQGMYLLQIVSEGRVLGVKKFVKQ
jgi:hypothetical protein